MQIIESLIKDHVKTFDKRQFFGMREPFIYGSSFMSVEETRELVSRPDYFTRFKTLEKLSFDSLIWVGFLQESPKFENT